MSILVSLFLVRLAADLTRNILPEYIIFWDLLDNLVTLFVHHQYLPLCLVSLQVSDRF